MTDTARTATAELRRRVAALMPAARADLERFVRIPSVALPGSPQAPLVEAAEAVAAIARRTGLETRLLDVPGSPPALLGERPAQPGAPTVLLYAHYDVQPPGPEERWTSPPYVPAERGGRLFGRGGPTTRPAWSCTRRRSPRSATTGAWASSCWSRAPKRWARARSRTWCAPAPSSSRPTRW